MRKPLEEVIAEKIKKGEERIVVSISFKFTDPFEMELLEHFWLHNHSKYFKRQAQRDKEGMLPTPHIIMEYQEKEEEEDVSSFI